MILSLTALTLLTLGVYGFPGGASSGLEQSETDRSEEVSSSLSGEDFDLIAAIDEEEDTAKPIADNTLLGHWTFDHADAGRNVAAREFPASVNRKTRIAEGITGKAIALSVRDSAKLSVKVSPDILPIGLREFTFFAWIAPDKIEKGASVLCKEDVGQFGQNRMSLIFHDNGFLVLGINCGENYAECSAPVSPRELCDGHWHLVAGTFDRQNIMHVYLDGREIASFERQTTINTVRDFTPTTVWRDDIANSDYQSIDDLTLHGEPLFIGSTEGKKNFFSGKIDEVRFYSRALDEKQIADLYAEGKQPVSELASKARKIAAGLYDKGDSFLATLASTDKNITEAAKLDESCAAELSYLLHRDYPAETNAYIMKWKKSPVANLLLDEKQRREAVNKLAEPAFEYLPLTEMQWQVLPRSERSSRERAKAMRALFNEDATALLADAKLDKNALGTMLYEMETLVEERPRIYEPVAKYVKPVTPETVNRTSDEARKVLEKDWMFQCDDKPTVERSLKEIEWARKLAARLHQESGASKSAAEKLEQLQQLESKAKAKESGDEDAELYFAVRTVKREIQFSNPVIDFESVLY
ncbi:MAG: LamG domain-containing protein, partial [Prevotellaceae bacterium]|nr:LamG domain-containing protein [Prevotellaceae bacterium]